MLAFTINGQKISDTIAVLQRGSSFYISSDHLEVPIGNNDSSTTVISDRTGRLYIRYCGVIVTRSGKLLVTAPNPNTKDLDKDKARAAINEFDHSTLVLWQTGDPKSRITESSPGTKLFVQGNGEFLLTMKPASTISLKISGQDTTLIWTGYEFYWE